MNLPVQAMEMWLLGWSKSHNSGCKVTFQIEEEQLPYFENATIRKGKHAGQRYQVVLVQLTDQDTPDPESVVQVVQAPPLVVPDVRDIATYNAPRAAPKVGHAHFPTGLCGLAVKWCNDSHFWGWLEEHFPREWCESVNKVKPTNKTANLDRAALVVREVCCVVSRQQLDEEPYRHYFKARIFDPYTKARKEGGVDG